MVLEFSPDTRWRDLERDGLFRLDLFLGFLIAIKEAFSNGLDFLVGSDSAFERASLALPSTCLANFDGLGKETEASSSSAKTLNLC